MALRPNAMRPRLRPKPRPNISASRPQHCLDIVLCVQTSLTSILVKLEREQLACQSRVLPKHRLRWSTESAVTSPLDTSSRKRVKKICRSLLADFDSNGGVA